MTSLGLEGLKDEYNSLTDKADKLGGVQNLTNEEYKRYTEIMSQILGITPKLITGWDNEGNAISNKNGLLQQSIDLLDEEYEKSVRNNTTKKKNEEVAKGVITELNEFENSADTKTIGGTISPLMLDFTDALKKVDNKNDKLNDYDIAKQLYTYLYPNAKDLSELEKGTGNWIERLKNIIYDKKDFEKLSKSFTDKNNPIYDLFSDKDIDHMIENANDYFKEVWDGTEFYSIDRWILSDSPFCPAGSELLFRLRLRMPASVLSDPQVSTVRDRPRHGFFQVFSPSAAACRFHR